MTRQPARQRGLAALAAVTAATAVLAIAEAHASDDPVENAIPMRDGNFSILGTEIGPLAAMAKGEADHDPETAMRHARNLAALAAYDPAALFPGGSSKAEREGDTRALPAIWEDMAGFRAAMAAVAEAAAGLPEVAGDEREALAGGARGRRRRGRQDLRRGHDDHRADAF